MKPTLIKILFGASLFTAGIPIFAADSPQPVAGGSNSSTATIIYTTEKVPGAVCECVSTATAYQDNPDMTPEQREQADQEGGMGSQVPVSVISCGDPSTRKYKCTVQPGLTGFQNIFAQIVKTIVYIVMLLGVLAIVGLGIAWAWAGGEDVKMKSTLKNWAINVLVGLTILFFFRYILTFLAPWIFQ